MATSSNNLPVPDGTLAPGTHGSGNGAIDMGDPRTRAIVEQVLSTLTLESHAQDDKVTRGFRLTDYLGIVRRRGLYMAVLFVLTFAAVAYKLRPQQITYVAEGTMLLPASSGAMGMGAAAGSAATDALSALGISRGSGGGSTDTEIAILTSPKLVATAMKTLNHDLRRRGWKDPNATKATVDAKAPTSPAVITITVNANDPEAAATLNNAIVQTYIQRTKNMASDTDRERLKQLKEQLSTARKLLTDAKVALRNYKTQHDVMDINAKTANYSARAIALQTKVESLRTEVAAGTNSSSIISDALESTLRQKRYDTRSRYEATLRDFYPTSPEAIEARQAMDDAYIAWKKRVDSLQSTTRERLARAEAEFSEAKAILSDLPEQEKELTGLQTNALLLQNTYQTLSDRYTAFVVTQKTQVDTATPLTEASKETAIPQSTTWTRVILLAVLCALAMAVLIAALMEQLDNTPHTVEDLEPMLHTSVLGTVPLLKGRSERRLAHVTNAQPSAAALLESFRILRSHLLFSTTEGLSSVLITSADPGEGKSLCAFNLATVMALDGKRVILLDCDLRRPAQHLLANLQLEPGFSNVLAGEIPLDQALRPTAIANLSLLSAGALPPNPPELVGSKEGRNLIERLKSMCDLVIIDSPPVLSLTDAQVLSSLADGVVLVVAADTTPKPNVQRAQAMLRHVGGRLLGVIFNKTKAYNDPTTADAYYDYYSYGDLVGNGSEGKKPKSLDAPKA